MGRAYRVCLTDLDQHPSCSCAGTLRALAPPPRGHDTVPAPASCAAGDPVMNVRWAEEDPNPGRPSLTEPRQSYRVCLDRGCHCHCHSVWLGQQTVRHSSWPGAPFAGIKKRKRAQNDAVVEARVNAVVDSEDAALEARLEQLRVRGQDGRCSVCMLRCPFTPRGLPAHAIMFTPRGLRTNRQCACVLLRAGAAVNTAAEGQ